MKNRWDKDNLINLVGESLSISEVLNKMGLKAYNGNYESFKKKVKLYNIDITHFIPYGVGSNQKYQFKKKYETCDILVENSTYSRVHLKARLYKEGLKKRECEICGQGEEWNGVKMSLILDHINGINDDNRIENLRIVCPNCNATLPTHCKGTRKLKNKKQCSCGKFISKHALKCNKCESQLRKKTPTDIIEKKCSCGKSISNGSIKCRSCSSILQRKVIRPSYEQLIKEIEETNYSAVGRKYGVSDNAIRKWIKNYENK